MEQAINDSSILNTDKIRRYLISKGVPEEEASDAMDDVDIRLNKALHTKANTTDVKDMLKERLEDVATKDFVRAEIQAQSSKLQWRLIGAMMSLGTIFTMATIFGLPYMFHMMNH